MKRKRRRLHGMLEGSGKQRADASVRTTLETYLRDINETPLLTPALPEPGAKAGMAEPTSRAIGTADVDTVDVFSGRPRQCVSVDSIAVRKGTTPVQ
jgi:hypothetical protein